MKSLYSVLALLLMYINVYSQKFHFLETFDSINSVNSWKISNNGVMLHTNHFTFNGKTFYKNTMDSFLVFYDNNNIWNYSINLSKKFKAIPSQSIRFSCSLFSHDSMYDKGYATYRIYDINKKSLFVFPFLMLPMNQNNVVIAGGGISLNYTKDDTLWKKADSIEISFHFNPMNPYDTFKRMLIIDEIYLENVFASIINNKRDKVEIYPNPASNVIYIKYLYSNIPKQVNIYDNIGRLIIENCSKEYINIENLKSGIYTLKIKYKDGNISINKIEVY